MAFFSSICEAAWNLARGGIQGFCTFILKQCKVNFSSLFSWHDVATGPFGLTNIIEP
jgi:hypothetical protein